MSIRSTRSRRRVALPVVLVVTALVPVGFAQAAPCWSPPVTASVTDHFREPACAWCPGNRGIEYGTAGGEPVLAVASGVVTFAGSVAGTRYVVVRHADGRRVTYGNVADTTNDNSPAAGDAVTRGSVVGRAAGRFHLGLRDGDRYIDPAPFIGVLRGVVRLIPVDGSTPAPAPPPRLRCPGG